MICWIAFLCVPFGLAPIVRYLHYVKLSRQDMQIREILLLCHVPVEQIGYPEQYHRAAEEVTLTLRLVDALRRDDFSKALDELREKIASGETPCTPTESLASCTKCRMLHTVLKYLYSHSIYHKLLIAPRSERPWVGEQSRLRFAIWRFLGKLLDTTVSKLNKPGMDSISRLVDSFKEHDHQMA